MRVVRWLEKLPDVSHDGSPQTAHERKPGEAHVESQMLRRDRHLGGRDGLIQTEQPTHRTVREIIPRGREGRDVFTAPSA